MYTNLTDSKERSVTVKQVQHTSNYIHVGYGHQSTYRQASVVFTAIFISRLAKNRRSSCGVMKSKCFNRKCRQLVHTAVQFYVHFMLELRKVRFLGGGSCWSYAGLIKPSPAPSNAKDTRSHATNFAVHRERKCADTTGTVLVPCMCWPFPMLKYKYIFFK